MQQASLKSLRAEFINPYTRMLPIKGWQADVYRMAENIPPGLEGYQPRWEVVNAVLGAQQQVLVKVDLMTDFWLMAVQASASVSNVGGFRAQIFDALKKLQLTDRGLQQPNIGGAAAAPFFLREPYHFDLPRSQMLVRLTNMEAAVNTVQMVFYGVAAPFPGTLSNELDFQP
jgi:hypothetical protein